MPCIAQSAQAWGEGASGVSRVVLRSAGHIRASFDSEYRGDVPHFGCMRVASCGLAVGIDSLVIQSFINAAYLRALRMAWV
jgi:hypothetical protein